MQTTLAKEGEKSHTYQVGDQLSVASGEHQGAIIKILGQPKTATGNTYRCEVIGGECEKHFISVEETDFDSESLKRDQGKV